MSRRPAILSERRWMALAVLVALALGQAVTMIVTAFATRDVFMYLRDGGASLPVDALVAIALAGTALCVLRAIEGRVGERAGQSYAAAIRRTLFSHMTRMPTSAIARRRSGALALRYVGDLAAFKGWIARGLARLISASITIPAAFLILYLLEPHLFLTAFGPIAIVMAGIFLLSSPLGKAHADLRSKRARLAAGMAERLPQGIALRRSGRVATELKILKRQSHDIADAAVRREWLAATVRALPDAGSGVAGALCLWTCIQLGLGVPDAVAALTALAMIVWPLRHLADVTDRRRAYVVASDKLDRLMETPCLPTPPKEDTSDAAHAIAIVEARMPGLRPFDLGLKRTQQRRLEGPASCGKSALLLALAGFDTGPDARRFEVLGGEPGALKTGQLLYLGRQAPRLKGSLRREATMGIGHNVTDADVTEALTRAGLGGLLHRVGGLNGKIAEGRRNMTATEQARLHVARALLSRPALALVDADEIGLDSASLALLMDHFRAVDAAALFVTSDAAAVLRLGPPVTLRPDAEAVMRPAYWKGSH